MPASPRITLQEITNALLRWGGNVQATSEALGMRRNSLQERIERAGIDLAAIRNSAGSRPVTPIAGVIGMPGMPGINRDARYGRKNASAPFTNAPRGRILSGVQQATQDAAPVAAFDGRRPKPQIRIRPDLIERLSNAKYELQHALRQDIDEGQIANAILAEQLDAWLEQTLVKLRQQDPAAPKTRRGKRALASPEPEGGR